jgi:hypothetical protein
MWYKVNKRLIWTTKVRPSWWKPWANTVAYYPLTSSTTTSDMSGNNRNLTNSWVIFGTNQWVSCASFNGSSTRLRYSNFYNLSQWDYCINFWAYKLTQTSNDAYVFAMWTFKSAYKWQSLVIQYDNNVLRFAFWFDDLDSDINPWNQRVNIWVKFKKSTNQQFIYVNGVLRNSRTTTYTHTLQVLNLYIGSWYSTDTWVYINHWNWYLSNLIVEKSWWSDSEFLDYYNQTKSNYWL